MTYRLGGKPMLTEYGYTTKPGRWDHWPGGFIASLAAENGVDGRVVMAPGDIVFPLKRYIEEPVEYVIEGGWVKEINGAKQAAELRGFMDAYEDPRAYAVSHIGWGLNENACGILSCPASAWTGARITAMCCFRSARIPNSAATTIPPAISICQCRTAISGSTTN